MTESAPYFFRMESKAWSSRCCLAAEKVFSAAWRPGAWICSMSKILNWMGSSSADNLEVRMPRRRTGVPSQSSSNKAQALAYITSVL